MITSFLLKKALCLARASMKNVFSKLFFYKKSGWNVLASVLIVLPIFLAGNAFAQSFLSGGNGGGSDPDFGGAGGSNSVSTTGGAGSDGVLFGAGGGGGAGVTGGHGGIGGDNLIGNPGGGGGWAAGVAGIDGGNASMAWGGSGGGGGGGAAGVVVISTSSNSGSIFGGAGGGGGAGAAGAYGGGGGAGGYGAIVNTSDVTYTNTGAITGGDGGAGGSAGTGAGGAGGNGGSGGVGVYLGNTSVTLINSGSISGGAGGAGGSALSGFGTPGIDGDSGPGVYVAAGSTAQITNNASGTINATSSSGNAYGILNYYGTIDTLNNAGSINATSSNGVAIGIDNFGAITTLNNSGSINATSGSGDAEGIYNNRTIDALSNTGSINATSDSGGAYGILNSGTITTLNNAGSINATSDTDSGGATGIANTGTITTLSNTGSINATSISGIALGIQNSYSTGTITTLNNAGSINATSDSGGANGILNSGTITTLNNAGSINATSNSVGAIGIANAGTITTLNNTGSINATSSSGNAYGISNNGAITTLNNTQGGNSGSAATTALTYDGNVPANYNIGIVSSTHYGQLAVDRLTYGTSTITNFGIYGTPFLTSRTYASVLTNNVTVTNLQSTYDNMTLALVDNGTTYDLTFTGASLMGTQQSLVNTANALAPIYTLQNSVLANSFAYDCTEFGVNNICVSAGGRNTAVSAANGLNNTSALLIGAYRQHPNYRVGAYVDQNLSVNNAGSTVNLGNNTPLIGLFGAWNERLDGTGTEVKLSAAYGQKNATITRQVVGLSEPGSGSSQLNSQGAQIAAKYGFGVIENVIISPYIGMRYTQNNMNGYTEGASSSVTAPLTYAALNTNATTALAGVGVSYKVVPQVTTFASAGVETDTNTANGTYSATGINGLTPVNFNPNPVKTRPTATLGAYYDIVKNQRLGLTGIYRQEAYQGVSTTTVIATYTIGL